MRKRWQSKAHAAGLLVLVWALALGLSAQSRDHGLTPIEGSWFLELEPGADRAALGQAVEARGGLLRHEYALTPRRVNVRGLTEAAAHALVRMPGVAAVTPDYEVRASLAESIPLIGALADDPAMAGTSGGAGVAVCVLDTGINPGHLMFEPVARLVGWHDFVNGRSSPYDDDGHGTNVAGIVAGRTGLKLQGKPFQGVAPQVNLLVGKVLNASGSGTFSDVQAGIDWCTAQGAHVINLSLGAGSFQTVCDTSDPTGTAPVVNAAAAAGVLVVSSVGNGKYRNASETPACASGSMAIGATYDADVGLQWFTNCRDRVTAPDKIACFSNRWDYLDVVAPGCETASADHATTNGTVTICGTSQAAPHVAGLAALILVAEPTLSNWDVRDRINSSAEDLGDPGFDSTYGHGRIDAAAAVNGGPPPCVPTESPEVTCDDGLDNDCDASVDCDDSDCDGDEACACLPVGAICIKNAECCSNSCKNNKGTKTCR